MNFQNLPNHDDWSCLKRGGERSVNIQSVIDELNTQLDILQELVEHPQSVRTESERARIQECVALNNRAHSLASEIKRAVRREF